MSLFPRRPQRTENLLPANAYPPDPSTGAPMPAARRANVDHRIRELLTAHPLPTEPGTYIDGQGDRWVLDADGGWTDNNGIHRDARYAPIIALFVDLSGPLVRVPQD